MGFKQTETGWFGQFQANGHRKAAMLRDYMESKAEPANRREAEAAFERFKADVRTGKAFVPDHPDAKMSITAYVEYYKKNHLARKERSGAGDPAMLNVIARYFGKLPLSAWSSPLTFNNFYDHLRTDPIKVRRRVKGKDDLQWISTGRTRSAKTISDYKIRLKHMVKRAVAWKLLPETPFVDDELMGENADAQVRARGVSLPEEKALLEKADVPMAERLKVAIKLGPRRGEMQRAQLKDIDFDEWTWYFPAYKTGPFGKKGELKKVRNTKSSKKGQENGRTIPIPSSLQSLFKAKRQTFGLNKDAFLFGEDGHYVASFKKAWATLKRDAKLSDDKLERTGKLAIHWHDLRGEAGTRMLDAGMAPASVADILGNTVEVLMAHYKGDLMKSMREGLERTEAK